MSVKPSLKPLRIINGNGPAEQSLQELTRQMGFMEEFGIEPEYIGSPDGRKGLAMLLAGDGDVCLQLGFGPALAAIEQGTQLKILAGANLRTVHALFSSSPRIRRVKDLEGARVGIGSPGALTHQLITAVLLKVGADPKKVDFVSVGNSHDVFKAVTTREVDAGLGEVDNLHQQAEFGIHALEDGDLWDQLPEFTNQASYATQKSIEAKRELIVGALAASAKLYRFICGPDSWPALDAARRAALPHLDPKEGVAQWDFYQKRKPYCVDLVIGEERLDYMQKLNVAMGLQTKVLPFSQTADMSLARDAIKLLESR
jgi:ABC-type nitrate/sulfonate/bicarbonate transport system substrate-binding protein